MRAFPCLGLATVLALAPVACGGGTPNAGDDVRDAAADAADAGDLAADTAGEATGDTAPDATDVLPDLPGDALPDAPADLPADGLADADVVPGPCTFAQVPRPPADPTRTKFALTMFHWNTQYVAGGLKTTWNGQPLTACGVLFGDDSVCDGDWSDDALVDWILTQSFEPVLDLYLAHPDWRTTFETPGVMIEAMEARHPAMLRKLQAAVQSGQIELVSFHWSAQLFLAYPARDLAKSQAIDDAIFQDACLPVSPVVFNQEGQDGPGKHQYMADHGYTVDVMHENLFRYVHWGTTPWPVYRDRGVKVVVGMRDGLKDGPNVDPDSGVQVSWPFFDDGEVLATPGDPYLAPLAGTDPGSVATYEARLQALADQGFTMTTFTDYLRDLDARGVQPRDLPPIADSTWQPIDTNGIQQWMGHHGSLGLTWPYERDNDERTATYATGQFLAAGDVLLAAAADAGADVTAARVALDGAWRDLLLAEVSDATGINPWPGEFVYGITHDDAARTAGDLVVTNLLALLGWPHAQIDVAAGTATRIDGLPEIPALPPADPPFEVAVAAPSRALDVGWFQAGTDDYQMRVQFGPMADPSKPDDDANRVVSVTFPRFDDVLRYTPGLSDHEVLQQPLSDFTLQDGRVFLPLPNGLIGLGDDWWVIKHCATVHLAAEVPYAAEVAPVVRFTDETAIPDDSRTWVFTVFRGSADDALALAGTLNSFPMVYR